METATTENDGGDVAALSIARKAEVGIAEGAFGELQFLRGVHYQNMEGWPDYWQGMPPMYYPYHGLGPIFYLAGKRARKVHCLGSGRLPEELQQTYGNPYPVESALFQLEDSHVTCEVTCCLFQMTRSFTVDRFYVYGDKLGFEAAQIPGEDVAIFEAEQGELREGQRGRNVSARRAKVPPLPELVPSEISAFVSESRNPRVIAIAHEFIRSIVEERAPSIDIATAANWTAASICAHESAMQEGREVIIPNW